MSKTHRANPIGTHRQIGGRSNAGRKRDEGPSQDLILQPIVHIWSDERPVSTTSLCPAGPFEAELPGDLRRLLPRETLAELPRDLSSILK